MMKTRGTARESRSSTHTMICDNRMAHMQKAHLRDI
jgi:hypothetical protein